MTTSLCFAVLLIVINSWAVSADKSLSGPCKEWLRNDCHGTGEWVCTTVEVYERSRFGHCPTPNLEPPTPPPGQCRLENGICQYAQPAVICNVSVSPDCYCSYLCNTSNTSGTTVTRANYGLPPPDMLCIPVNDTCQWYNPCHYWRGFCQSGYQCGTVEQYYDFIFGPQPQCAPPPEGWVEPLPPGDCIAQEQKCEWSNLSTPGHKCRFHCTNEITADCTAFMDWCQSGWICGTEYDNAVVHGSPPPSCPQPPPPTPPLPGVCQFNLTARKCQFQPAAPVVTSEPSLSHKIIATISAITGVLLILIAALCVIILYACCIYKDDGSISVCKNDGAMLKHSELKFEDSIGFQSSLEKEDLSIPITTTTTDDQGVKEKEKKDHVTV